MMNSRLLMMASALFMGVIGIILSFLPHETMDYLAMGTEKFTVQFLKILGAFYLGFAMLNWLAKGNIIGGIYSKPVAVGNFMHFAISSVSLLKFLWRSETHLRYCCLLRYFMLFSLLPLVICLCTIRKNWKTDMQRCKTFHNPGNHH